MPDWSYHTLFFPWLRRLPGQQARDLTLRAAGGLAALPRGSLLFATFGHMRPPVEAASALGALPLQSRVGLAGEVDPSLLGTRALAHFGVGFLEVGPVTLDASPEACGPRLTSDGHSIVLADAPVSPGMATILARLELLQPVKVPLLVRITPRPGLEPEAADEQVATLVCGLAGHAAGLVLETRWSLERWPPGAVERHLCRARAGAEGKPLLLNLAPDAEPGTRARLVEIGRRVGVDGWVISGGVRRVDGERLVGPPTRDTVEAAVRHLRSLVPRAVPIVAEGGIEEPLDALTLRAAGADLLLLHSGLVTAGPGLPKRVNEAVAATEPSAARSRPARAPLWRQGWPWLFGLGLAMVLAGATAWLVAATRIVLPYDEAFLGLDRAGLDAINPRLLAFMAHDRVTLAGTMVSIGVLYAALAWWGIRAGAHWAWQATVCSASVGFASFFLFLGFGYFDPLHAAISVVLFAFFLLGLQNRPRGLGRYTPGLRNDAAWRLSLWGQLCFVSLGFGLVLAGLRIAAVGVTGVFVPEDLQFLASPADVLRAANDRLMPLVAHDRAGFGGALVSNGLCVLFASLWGFRMGARWLWAALAVSGAAGFVAAVGVHAAVGYLDLLHIGPAVLGSVVFAVGLGLTIPYLWLRRGDGASSSPATRDAARPAPRVIEPDPVPNVGR